MATTASGIVIPEYPKIETLFDRNPENMKHVIPWQFRAAEFALVGKWSVTEKIDGTNVRVIIEDGQLRFGGRTADAQMPLFLLDRLREIFTPEKLAVAFPSYGEPEGINAVLFGEGYGAKIQKGGGNYRSDTSFRLFDVAVWGDNGRGSEQWWWLLRENMLDIAEKLDIETVPLLTAAPVTTEEAIVLLAQKSIVALTEGATQWRMEGIVGHTDPPLFSRRGDRLIWKLKARDFPLDLNSFTADDVRAVVGARAATPYRGPEAQPVGVPAESPA